MRFLSDQSTISHVVPKCIVLDADIDPLWIESLNTVMNNNKIITADFIFFKLYVVIFVSWFSMTNFRIKQHNKIKLL